MYVLLVAIIALLPASADAASISDYWPEFLPSPCDGGFFIGCDFTEIGSISGAAAFLVYVARAIYALASSVTVLAFLYAAFQMIAQQGELDKAKNAMKWALIGFVLVQLGYVFINAIVDFFFIISA